MRQRWAYKNFEDCLVKAAKAKQVQTSEYNSGSKYPIISQEDKMVSGYCDDDSLLYHIDNPVVIFGDHTRVLKYVDFDFVVGADGVKILIPKEFLKAKFLLYYLRWYQVPSLGYSRHYKLLKEIVLPVPPVAEQERIVAELDLLQGIIEKKKEQLKAYDQLAQSIFYTMFGDIFTNNKSWDIEPLGNFCEIKGRIGFRGYTKNDFVSCPDEGAISLSPTNIVNGSMDYSKCSYVTWEKYFESPEIMIQNGDILLVKTGSSYGKCSLVRHLPHKATINPQFVVIKDIQLNNVYLTFVLSSDYAKYQYDRFVLGTAIPTFSQKSLAGLGIPVPPLSLQQEFAEKVEAIERQKALVQQSIDETQTMFDFTMDKYFG